MYAKDYDVFLFERVWEFRAQVRNCPKTRSWAGAVEGRSQADENSWKNSMSSVALRALHDDWPWNIYLAGNGFGRQCR